MTRRYYCPRLPPSGGETSLADAEAQHAIRVMRVQIGDSVTLFDGQGNESEAKIVDINRRTCFCMAEKTQSISRESSVSMHLAIALPKPDRCRELIERLTEIGVQSITPIVAARTQRGPSASLIEKLYRFVIESCKQCGRNQLMSIEPVTESRDYFGTPAPAITRRLIAHPIDAMPLDSQIPANPILAAIGPEGGWTNEEVELAVANGFSPISLGKRIYRIETAAVVVAARLLD
ncbi:Ribosomal RNA small subunit methyltransferase E [Planctomycetes bacterium CA13]|uniref:Ribosomal RNA small subunit methyltransferase E n=1 Tax=Novipirellula herctigrandis TaxID=2527986 RepID=A0A5C5Z9Q3_9BACT|nr:Ribosomal RNA small subunit methyltransferase E [Planctomycetes bacterium CA13]